MVNCKICNENFNINYLATHIKKHNYNSKQYYDKFLKKENEGFCLNCNKETKLYGLRQYAKYCSNKCKSEHYKIRYCGRKLTDKWIKNQNNAKKNKNWKKYGNYSCKKCNKNFDSNTSLRAHKSYCSDNDKLQKICDKCNKIFSSRGYKIHNKLVHCDADTKQKHSINILNGIKNRKQSKVSKVEFEFLKLLKNYNVVHGFKIKSYNHIYDFYLPDYNLIIELDGEYWHGNKDVFVLTDRMKKQYRIDESNSKIAINNNYNLIRVWTKDYKKFINNLEENNANKTIKNFINKYNWKETDIRHYNKKES